MGCIYMRTSPSGKSYIGLTSFAENKRWKQHVSDAYNKNSPNYNTPLCRSIRKYGPESFVCTILEDNISDPNYLKEREVYWISRYNTFQKGLNATRGGDGCTITDTQKVQGLWDQGHCVRDICLLMNIDPATALLHLRMTPKEAEKRGPVYKTKNSMKYFGDFKTGRGIPISCYDMETGNYVRSFQSYYEAAKFFDVKDSSAILRASKGIIKSAFGHYWKEGEDQTSLSEEELSARRTRSKREIRPIVCVERNVIYQDACYVQELTGICYRSITFACNGGVNIQPADSIGDMQLMKT